METNMIADRDSHLNLQLPLEREEFTVSWTFTSDVGQRMAAGFIPDTFEDRWFILMEDGWLYFHRAQTGTCIFGLKVDITTEETKVSQGWVNRGTSYISESIKKDIETVRILINQYFQTARRL
ncbi:MAG: hypothetical protein CFE36_13975 [Sphingomonadaceae bacterium PASS1]|nr:MAG: hypothetical protein CFE36_13975 [Sphingomonadaceae bacterium PASS1]